MWEPHKLPERDVGKIEYKMTPFEYRVLCLLDGEGVAVPPVSLLGRYGPVLFAPEELRCTARTVHSLLQCRLAHPAAHGPQTEKESSRTCHQHYNEAESEGADYELSGPQGQKAAGDPGGARNDDQPPVEQDRE